jgi:hypothetical protein
VAAPPPSPGKAEVAVVSPRPVDKPALSDTRSSERPPQTEPPSLIDHALSVVKRVIISEQKAVLVKQVVVSEPTAVQTAAPPLQPPVAKQAPQGPLGDARSNTSGGQALSMVSFVAVAEPSRLEDGPPPSPKTAKSGVVSGVVSSVVPQPRSADKPASQATRPLEHPTRDAQPSPIGHAHSTAAEAAPTAPKTEFAASLAQQPAIGQLSAKEQLDIDLADIRRRVAIFKEQQQRSQREREEYHAATTARALHGGVGRSGRDSG